MSAFDTLATKIAEAVAAIESGDWLTAQTKVIAANALLLTIPDTDQQGNRLQWRSQKELIESLHSQIARGRQGALGLRRSKFVPTVTSGT